MTKKIFVADEFRVANAFKRLLEKDLEGVVVDTHSWWGVKFSLEGYDLLVTDPMHFKRDLGIFRKDDPYVFALERLSVDSHLCFCSTQDHEIIKSFFDPSFFEHLGGKYSYAHKPVDTLALSVFVGRYLGVKCKLPEELQTETVPNVRMSGPIFRS